MADKICTNFTDDDGLDVGCHLITKEYLLENYPSMVPWIKTPALWVWGNNFNSTLGTNNSNLILRSSPVQTVSSGTNWKQVTAGTLVAAAIKTDGTLWAWGVNAYGNLGRQNTTPASSPVQTISGGTNWKQVSAGYATVGAVKTDGSLWIWGYNQSGQLGNNSITNASSPVQTVSNVTTWKNVSTSTSVAAIKTDGTLWLWGANGNGQLGNNSIVSASSPVQTVSNVTTWKSISTSGSISAAIKTDGTLWAWGQGYHGSLGNNSTVGASSPVQTISSGTNWKSVSVGNTFTAAIKTDGTLWTWGRNNSGQLGRDNLTWASSPVQTVSGGTNWFKVSTYFDNASAIKTDGTLWMWGRGYYGLMADNTVIDRSSPVQVTSNKTAWRDISINSSALGINDEGDF